MTVYKQYRLRVRTVGAVQWLKMGDHPSVTPLRKDYPCQVCGVTLLRHGLLMNDPVCPGDWILTHPDSSERVMSDIGFRTRYEEDV